MSFRIKASNYESDVDSMPSSTSGFSKGLIQVTSVILQNGANAYLPHRAVMKISVSTALWNPQWKVI